MLFYYITYLLNLSRGEGPNNILEEEVVEKAVNLLQATAPLPLHLWCLYIYFLLCASLLAPCFDIYLPPCALPVSFLFYLRCYFLLGLREISNKMIAGRTASQEPRQNLYLCSLPSVLCLLVALSSVCMFAPGGQTLINQTQLAPTARPASHQHPERGANTYIRPLRPPAPRAAGPRSES